MRARFCFFRGGGGRGRFALLSRLGAVAHHCEALVRVFVAARQRIDSKRWDGKVEWLLRFSIVHLGRGQPPNLKRVRVFRRQQKSNEIQNWCCLWTAQER
ncbi:hypothetical protein DFJ73DRAFT_863806 [Zopfochytrium polystomum]|nr:hypothetical protein DFJ73DRAFT_863806 [Zopfochytrium polystomum]